MKQINDKYILDDVDRYIIRTLIQNSRTTYSEMANCVGISRIAIEARINRMQKAGIIECFTTIINWELVMVLD